MKKYLHSSVVLYFFFMCLSLQGQSWSGLERLTWNSGNSQSPSIATTSGGGIHMVWYDDSPGNSEIFYKKSTDGGSTWTGLKRLTWNSGYSTGPSIAAGSGGVVHVAWSDYSVPLGEIFYKRSTDSGGTWTGLQRLTWNSGISWPPSVAVDSGNKVHIIWGDRTPGNFEIFYKSSTDGGQTWTGLQRLTWNSGDSRSQSIASDISGGIHVVWRDDSPGNDDLFYKRSTDGGATWLGLVRLTWNSYPSLEPSIAADTSSGIHVVWRDSMLTNDEIFYKRSTDNGATWSGIMRFTWNVGFSAHPSVAADSGSGIHVVWLDSTPMNYEIFYKVSTNGGGAWSGLTRLTWNAGSSENPSAAADSGNGIHVVWQDDTPGNIEIFYKNRK